MMKKNILFFLVSISKVVFSPFEGTAYMGLHRDIDNLNFKNKIEQIKQIEAQNKSWIDHLRDLRDKAVKWGKNVFSKKSTVPNPEDNPEPVVMSDTMYDLDLDKEIQERREDKDQEDFLESQLVSLPKNKQPENIDTALKYMQEGEMLWEILKKNISHTAGNNDKIFNQIFPNILLPNNTENNQNLIKAFETGIASGLDSEIFKKFMQAYQKVIIKLQWYFYKLSILEDRRAFEGGTITFKDSEGNLFNFLKNYARLVNPNYESFWKSWNTKAYKRTSSHFKGGTEGKNIGLDIDVSNGELGLPLNAPHLLFDQRKNGYVFIKWEPHGIGTLWDVIAHGWSFIKTRGENDERKHSKDRIPQDVISKFWSLYKGSKTSEVKTQISIEGISGMLKLLTGKDQQDFQRYLTEERGDINKLRNYQVSTLLTRRGGEVIINPS